MSEWQDKSDKEINIAVTCFKNNLDCWEFNGDEFYHCGIDGSGYFPYPAIDYCNNPQDAWSIIELIWDKLNSNMERSHTTFWQHQINLNYWNKLRAAMIVFLEMNGVKPNE